MIFDIFHIILSCAEDAFLQVGVFVGFVLLLFGYINYRRQGGLVAAIETSKKWQPIIGALLGLSPGCGGAIFVMPLYLKGTVTFGTVIATLLATMGDSAFVLISTNLPAYIQVSLISIVVAILSGYLVDLIKIDSGFQKRKEQLLESLRQKARTHEDMEAQLIAQGIHPQKMQHIGHDEGDSIDILLHHTEPEEQVQEPHWAYLFTHRYAYRIFWGLVTIGLVLGVLLLFQVEINRALKIPHIGTVIGIGGTLFSIIYMVITRKVLQQSDHNVEESKIFSLKETLIHNAEDTAFVNVWVFVAYVIYAVTVYFLGGEETVRGWMMASGVTTVFVGALIGLIPGCGPQIIFVSLYAKGMIPFAALLANAISQDGDALFPLLAIDRKTALLATVVTTVPALLVGLCLYFLFP